MNATIRKELRSNPQDLFDKLTSNVQSPEIQTIVRVKLDAISEILGREKEIVKQRKQLSRNIGIAKKSGEDSSGLIAEVSSLSARINDIKQEIDDQIEAIESELAKNSAVFESTDGPDLPLHIRLMAEPSTATADANSYSTDHSRAFDTQEWKSFVDASEHATIYHDQRWKSLIESNFNHDHYLVSCRDKDQQLIGIMPLVHVRSRLFGSFTISMPYFNYGGPLAKNKTAEEALMSHAAKLSASLDCSHMEIRETSERSNWSSTQRKISMILPLPDSDQTLDKNLGSKLRAQVKKAQSHELTTEFGGAQLLDQFYDVFSRNMRDLGTPVYGKKFFADILANFPDDAFIALVHQNGSPLAAGFLLGYRDKLEIPWASSIRRMNHLGANMLMYREILREAIARDYQYFDFGRSTIDAPTHRFKKQWGAKEHPLHWHYWTQATEHTPELNPDNPKFKLAIMVWQRLPVAITRIIGPPLAKNLP